MSKCQTGYECAAGITKAVYRFWDNQRVDPEAMLGFAARLSVSSCVLLIQDTTNLDFAHHPSTKGLGHLDNLALFALPHREGSHMLIRATHHRRVETASHLYSKKAGVWSIHIGIVMEGSTTSAHERAVCELND